MNIQKKLHVCLLAAFVVAVVWPTALLRAQEEEPADGGNKEGPGWKAERAKLEKVIADRIEEKVNATVTKEKVWKYVYGLNVKNRKAGKPTLNWPPTWPVKSPGMTKEQVQEKLEGVVTAEAVEKFPDSDFKKEEVAIRKKYRVYERGEEISFRIRGGLGTNTGVSGQIYAVQEDRVHIGSRWLSRDDIDPQDQANLYQDVSDEFIERDIKRAKHQHNMKISNYKERGMRDRLPAALKAAGYIPEEGHEDSSNLKHWISGTERLDAKYQEYRQKYASGIKKPVEKDVFEKNNYTYVEEGDTKEWMPKQEAESFKAKLKRMLEEKKKKKDPFNGEPGMEGMPEGEMGMEGEMGGGQAQPAEEDIFEKE